MKLTIKLPGREPVELTHDDFASCPMEMQIADVSKIDDRRAGRAIQFGDFLKQLDIPANVTACVLQATADDYSNRVPIEAVREGFLIYELNGEPLASENGGPFRFFIANTKVCGSAPIDNCANVKFVDRIEIV